MGMFPPAPFLPTVQRGCHLQPARRSPLPSSHSAPGLLSPVHPLQPQQETHLSVRDAPRKERVAPGLGRLPCFLWAGGYMEYPCDREVEVGVHCSGI